MCTIDIYIYYSFNMVINLSSEVFDGGFDHHFLNFIVIKYLKKQSLITTKNILYKETLSEFPVFLFNSRIFVTCFASTRYQKTMKLSKRITFIVCRKNNTFEWPMRVVVNHMSWLRLRKYVIVVDKIKMAMIPQISELWYSIYYYGLRLLPEEYLIAHISYA